MSEEPKTELERINREFTRRDADPALTGRYSLFNPAALLHRQGQERHSLFFLKKYKLAISPNPASEALQVVFQLPKSESVKLEVLDALGRRVAVLLDNELLSAGEHGLNVPVGEWAAGVYGLYFKGENGGSAIRFLKK